MREFKINDDMIITDSDKVFIIAEIGHNHMGSVEHCKYLIHLAKEAGCDAVKLQKRCNKKLYWHEYYNKSYDNENSYGKTYGAHREALEFNFTQYVELKNYAEIDKNIIFFASAFDMYSVDFLEELQVPMHKVQSGDVDNLPLLRYIANKGKPIILSTGGASCTRIARAMNILRRDQSQVAVLHCVSIYPARANQLNLLCIPALAQTYENNIVGFSSHYDGIIASVSAYLYGAQIIEQHFTDSHVNKGSDHALSLQPQGMMELRHYLDEIFYMKGNNHKIPRSMEIKALNKLAKSVYFVRPLKSGQTIVISDIEILSPRDPDGVGPECFEEIVGSRALIDFEPGLLTKENYINNIQSQKG